jgi:hypothetical protein
MIGGQFRERGRNRIHELMILLVFPRILEAQPLL